jgi:hypothetical protein
MPRADSWRAACGVSQTFRLNWSGVEKGCAGYIVSPLGKTRMRRIVLSVGDDITSSLSRIHYHVICSDVRLRDYGDRNHRGTALPMVVALYPL